MSGVANNQQLPRVSHPPGPQGHWLLGSLREFRRDTLGTMTDWVRRYGDAVRFPYFWRYHAYLFCHPEHNRRILQENFENYTKLPNPLNSLLVPVVGYSLLTSDGALWSKLRRLSEPAFHRRRIASLDATITETVSTRLEKWRPLVEDGTPLDAAEEMTALALEIAGRILLSVDLTGEAEVLGKAFANVSRQFHEFAFHPLGPFLVKLDWLPATRRFKHSIARLDDVVYQIIAERRAQQANGFDDGDDDLLDMLMAAHDEETGEKLSDSQLRNETLTLLMGGQEPPANLLTWTLYLLSQHPEVRARMEQEVYDVLDGRVPTAADVHNLTYTMMVLEESMRLYPPTYAMTRSAQEADVVGGYHVEGGANVTISPYLTHRHPEFWDDPESFEPQRFSPEQKAKRPSYAYIPFSEGPRRCIGEDLGAVEAALVLAMIAQRYRLQLVPGHPVEPEPLITLRPRHGLSMIVEAR
ncbi:MAG TPA: cytochrome P450 [Candidatus Sulfomarinibacteraceae bacterium]|nr:cytochrome P450 [Candidatus Sulfomarinibacteraceae bacterium]